MSPSNKLIKSPDYLIIGSGVFGASTAYQLSKTHPSASIVILDRSTMFPCPLAASDDFNKIIRADYANSFYCKLALEAREVWTTDSLYKPFYHQSGMVILDETELGQRIIQNFEELNAYSEAEVIGTEELKMRYEGLFGDASLEGVKDVYVNHLSGWAEARRALAAVLEAALSNGVRYVCSDVERLLFDSSGDCLGVSLRDGLEIRAGKVILSTGAGTTKLLADSDPTRASLQPGWRITAAGVITGTVMLSEEQKERFKNAPVFVHAVKPVLGEVLPPTLEGLLKFCVDVSFRNTMLDPDFGNIISVPPSPQEQLNGTIPQSLKDECTRVVRGIFGKELDGFEFSSHRICWDAFTFNQDFIISPHPRCKNLYVATGGSFHGWKFLPILGKYVVQMLDGELEEELQQRWGWDKDLEGSAHRNLIPNRELRDLI